MAVDPTPYQCVNENEPEVRVFEHLREVCQSDERLLGAVTIPVRQGQSDAGKQWIDDKDGEQNHCRQIEQVDGGAAESACAFALRLLTAARR